MKISFQNSLLYIVSTKKTYYIFRLFTLFRKDKDIDES